LRDASRLTFGRPTTADIQVFHELTLLERFCEYCDQIGLRTPVDTIALREQHLDHNAQDAFFKFPDQWPNPALLELMAMAQHHGIPTRLLDWSRHAHTACYFATVSAIERHREWGRNDRLAIWVLDVAPAGLLADLVTIVRPPGSVTPHLAAQAGLFTIQRVHGARGKPLVVQGLDQSLWSSQSTRAQLIQLTLPVREAVVLFQYCEQAGISAATLYRSADGAAKATAEAVAAAAAEQWLLDHRGDMDPA
jgi:FRG domain-containing protein